MISLFGMQYWSTEIVIIKWLLLIRSNFKCWIHILVNEKKEGEKNEERKRMKGALYIDKETEEFKWIILNWKSLALEFSLILSCNEFEH